MKEEAIQQQKEHAASNNIASEKLEKSTVSQQQVIDFNAIKTEIQKQSKFFTNAKQEMFNEVITKMNASKDLSQFLEKIATHPKPQVITQVVEKIVHVSAKEGNSKGNHSLENNLTESGEIKREQKDGKFRRKNNDKKTSKPMLKHPSPDLTKSLEETSRMNRDLNSVSRHENSKLSVANNPFNGPLPS